MGLLLDGDGTLLREIDERAQSLSGFASVFTDKTRPQGSLTEETRVKECWKEDVSLVKEGLV